MKFNIENLIRWFALSIISFIIAYPYVFEDSNRNIDVYNFQRIKLKNVRWESVVDIEVSSNLSIPKTDYLEVPTYKLYENNTFNQEGINSDNRKSSESESFFPLSKKYTNNQFKGIKALNNKILPRYGDPIIGNLNSTSNIIFVTDSSNKISTLSIESKNILKKIPIFSDDSESPSPPSGVIIDNVGIDKDTVIDTLKIDSTNAKNKNIKN